MHPVYITAAGKFLPNDPVDNDHIEERLGQIHGKSSRVRERILKNNGIRTRYYALDAQGRVTHSTSEMAARAIRDAVSRSSRNLSDVDMICAATTIPDLVVPGFAAMVHGHLPEVGPTEILSSVSVCCAGMSGLSSAYAQVALGRRRCAVSVGCERASAIFRASRYEDFVDAEERLSFDAEFLRWMISDGAAAFVLENEPSRDGISLRLDWIDVISHAHDHPVCMYMGSQADDPEVSWTNASTFGSAVREGHMALRQDVRNVNEVIRLMCADFIALAEQGRVNVDEIDHLLVHYSSHFFRGDVMRMLAEAGKAVPEEKWFTNLSTRGNTGNASIYLMIEEMMNENMLRGGDKVVCLVPESGRYTTAYMQLTAVEGQSR
jgi:3-oxoacyl-[acyl-carrier-protein] synthase-3